MAGARDWYVERALPFPPVPTALESQLLPVGESVWATKSAATPIWDTKELAEERKRAFPPAQAAIGSSGRGLASNALYCNIVTDHIGLFVEHGIGNVGDDVDEQATSIGVDYTILGRIIDRAEPTADASMIVIYSTLRLHAAVFHEGQWTQHRTFELLHHVLDLLG